MLHVSLGLGLIGIGKPWGLHHPEVPLESDVQTLLESAYELGIRYFDTAASYGVSEQRLGAFLRRLDSRQRGSLTVATKFGEHWDAARGEPFVDHSYDALCRSLDRSLALLGSVDVLQLHKTTPEALAGDAVPRAFDYARRLGIAIHGVSVSDLHSAALAIASGHYSLLQLPYNLTDFRFDDSIDAATAHGLRLAINRPFAMGHALHDKPAAFAFILRKAFHGVILTGTKSPRHLAANWRDFHHSLLNRPPVV